MAARTFIAHTPLEDGILEFRSLDGDEGISTIFQFDLELVSRSPNIDAKDLIGAGMAIEIVTKTGDSRYLHGIVTSFEFFGPDTSDSTFYRYTATLRSWLILASMDMDSRIFQQKSIPQIIKETLASFGMQFEIDMSRSFDPEEYVVRFNESALTFVMRLAEAIGAFWYTRHSIDGHTIVFTDRYTPELANAPEIGFLKPDYKPLKDNEYITEWRIRNELQAGPFRTRSFDFKNPNTLQLDVKDSNPKNHAHDAIPVYEWDASYVDGKKGQDLARLRQAQQQLNWETVHAVTNVRDIAPGCTFTLKWHPRDAANRQYLIVEAHYHFVENVHSTRSDGAQTSWTIEFKARSTASPYVPLRVTPRPHIAGVHTAIVTGPPGQEVWCDAFGRIKALFSWDAYSQPDQNSSCWIRVNQLWSGNNFGIHGIPRIGQEVQIEYENGNINFPVVTGSVNNQRNMPPWTLPDNATQTGILTRSTPDGQYGNANALRFEDKKGAEQVWIQAERNMDTVVENDETLHVMHDRSKNIDHDETVHVAHDRSETVGNNETITVHANRKERVDADESISIGGNRTEDVGKDESVTISGSRTNHISKNHSETIGENLTETVTMAAIQNVGLAKMTNVGGALSINVALAMNTLVGMSQTEQVLMNKSVHVGKEYTFEAGDSILIKTGAASLSMKSDGTITISGKNILVDANGTPLQLMGKDIDLN